MGREGWGGGDQERKQEGPLKCLIFFFFKGVPKLEGWGGGQKERENPEQAQSHDPDIRTQAENKRRLTDGATQAPHKGYTDNRRGDSQHSLGASLGVNGAPPPLM